MVAIHNIVITAAAASGATASILAHLIDIVPGVKGLEARDDGKTVTVTVTTCPNVPPPGSTAPVETPATSVATTSGGYTPVLIPPPGSTTSAGVPPGTSSASVPIVTAPTSVGPPPVPSTPTTSVTHTTTEPASTAVETPPVTSSSTESVSTTTSMVPTTSTEALTSSTTNPVSSPPAVGGADKNTFNAGALALLAVAAFY